MYEIPNKRSAVPRFLPLDIKRNFIYTYIGNTVRNMDEVFLILSGYFCTTFQTLLVSEGT